MNMTKHYAHAPITEAIIDLRVKKLGETKLAALSDWCNDLSERYPTKFDRQYAEGTIHFGNEVSTKAAQNKVGYLLQSGDKKNVFQPRLDGFTFSRLAPYESWAPFSEEAHQLWGSYREIMGEIAISRLAVRYINRIELPLPMENLSDYLRFYPEIPDELPDDVSGLLMRLSIPHSDLGATCMLTETLENSSVPESASVILDIDLYRDQSVPQEDTEIWHYFEQLHDRKNQIFESCVTDRSRELFQ